MIQSDQNKFSKVSFLTLITLLAFSLGANAQFDSNKLRVGLNYSFEENRSTQNVPSETSSGIWDGYNANYNKNNFRVGLNFDYQLREKLSLNTAINFSNKDFTGHYWAANVLFDGPIPPQDLNLRFIEVPLTFRHNFFLTNLRPFAEFGINNFFLLSDNYSFLMKKKTTNTYGLGLIFGGGIEYNITNKFAAQFTIDYKTGHSRLYKNSDYNLQPLGYGIGLKTHL